VREAKIQNPISAHHTMKTRVGVDEPRPLVRPVLRLAAPGSDLSPAVKDIWRLDRSVYDGYGRTRVVRVLTRGQNDGDM
jgi:hypothetical protein